MPLRIEQWHLHGPLFTDHSTFTLGAQFIHSFFSRRHAESRLLRKRRALRRGDRLKPAPYVEFRSDFKMARCSRNLERAAMYSACGSFNSLAICLTTLSSSFVMMLSAAVTANRHSSKASFCSRVAMRSN